MMAANRLVGVASCKVEIHCGFETQSRRHQNRQHKKTYILPKFKAKLVSSKPADDAEGSERERPSTLTRQTSNNGVNGSTKNEYLNCLLFIVL